jgi:hypothetical protein
MGNARSHSEFTEHLRFLLREILRATMPGRLLSMHCMLLPTSKARDGIIGLTDFRGDLIRAAQAEGWAFHSEVTIWKDPVTAMQRTKAIGLLHKQLVKDSAMSRQGIPDYLCTFRKPGVNPEPVEKAQDKHWPDVTTRDSIELWQRYASPVWASSKGIDCEGFVEYCEPSNDTEDKRGIRATETLQYMSAREEKDERHICPLQLEVIQRGVRLWSNPGDVVLSPFAGIGSEGYIATRNGRRFVGFELKRSYYEQAVRNLRNARSQLGLFDTLEAS